MKKQTISWLVTALIIIITLEFIPFIAGSLFLHEGYSRKTIKGELAKEKSLIQDSLVQLANDDGGYLGEHLLHPYLGYVSIPRNGYNQFGFFGPDPLLKKSEAQVNMCITGGSVSKQLFQVAADRIKKNLQAHPAFAEKKINIVSLALGGFKQPQQLLSISYMQTLGAAYDIVINLDGFNEIALPLSDNLPFNVFPTYPRHWNIYSRKKLDQKVILQMGIQASLQNRRAKSRNRLEGSIFRHSNFILFLWKISDEEKHNKILQAEAELRKSIQTNEADYQSTGPTYAFQDTTSYLQSQAAFWSNASKQLSALANSGHFSYYHFLQPNQYDEESKELTGEEMTIAFEQGPFPYKIAARQGYPFLRAEGAKLLAAGVNYVDLSGIFKSEKRTVYSDKCCHFNELGYFTIADRITERILADF